MINSSTGNIYNFSTSDSTNGNKFQVKEIIIMNIIIFKFIDEHLIKDMDTCKWIISELTLSENENIQNYDLSIMSFLLEFGTWKILQYATY